MVVSYLKAPPNLKLYLRTIANLTQESSVFLEFSGCPIRQRAAKRRGIPQITDRLPSVIVNLCSQVTQNGRAAEGTWLTALFETIFQVACSPFRIIYASPTEESCFLPSWCVKFFLCFGYCSGHWHSAVAQGTNTVQNWSIAGQCYWTRIREVHW